MSTLRSDDVQLETAMNESMNGIVDSLVAEAIDNDLAQVCSAMQLQCVRYFVSLQRQAAYAAVHQRLLKLIYIGGCARNYSQTCPVGASPC